MSTINITNHFHAPIGQHIDHVEKIEAHFDKDMGMQIEVAGDRSQVAGEEGEKVDDLHRAFAEAIIAVQDLPYTDGKPYIREIRDHAAIEHLAAEMGVISSFNQHGEYLTFINNMSQQGLQFSRKPTNAPAISTYVNYIISTDPEHWAHTADLDACTFNRYLSMVNRIRIECQKRYLLG